MDKDKIGSEAWEELRQMARDLAAKEVDTLKASHKEDNNKLAQQITDLSARLEDSTQRLDAAEKLIDGYVAKVKEMEENPAGDEELANRHEAARKIIDACLKQIDQLKDSQKYAKAAEEVAQALLDKSDSENVARYISGALAGVKDESKRESVAKLIGGVKTIEEAKERLKALSNVVPFTRKTSTKEPLPGDDSGTLTEDEKTALEEEARRVAKTRPATFGRKLAARVAR